jgi:TonB family protein
MALQNEKPNPIEAAGRTERLPVKLLKTVFETKPSYTEQARLAGVEGTVIVYAEITEEGSPENLRVLRSLGFGLDEEAIKAVRQWRFEPDSEETTRRRVAMYVPVRFRLKRQIYDSHLPSSAAANDIYQITEGGITVPGVISRAAPVYTDEARAANVKGTVVLYAEITTAGTVENVVVLHKLEKGLDESAVRAVKQWKFSPALKDGRPVAVVLTIEMNFNVTDDAP